MQSLNGASILVAGDLEAAIYPRVSSAAQAEGYSLQTQQDGMLARARELGWRVRADHVYRETHTGEELFERPVLTRLRQAIARGEVQGVIFYDVDRFARDPVWIEMVTQECMHFGAQVAFVRGGDDLGKDTPEARVMRMLKGYAAQTELGQIKERTARGRRARVEDFGRLRPSSRGPLYGYAFADADAPDPGKKHPAPKVRYVPDPEQALIVRRIFTRCLQGCTIRALAHELEADGVPGPTGNGWSPVMVGKMLNDTSYYGEAYANRSRATKVRTGGELVRRKVKTPASDWVAYPPGVVPALIDRETFEAARALRGRNKREATRRLTDPEQFLLRGGYVFCGSCGDRMYVRHQTTARGTRSAVYWCTSLKHEGGQGRRVTIVAEMLDAEIWARLAALLDNPQTLGRKIEEMQANDPTSVDLQAIDSQQRQIERTITNLAKGIALVKTDESRAVLAEQLDASHAQAQRLGVERERVLERKQGWLDAQRHAVELQAWLGQLRGKADVMPYEMKRDALAALGIRVTVHPHGSADRWEMTAATDFVSAPINSYRHKTLFLAWASSSAGLLESVVDAVA